MSKVVWGCPHCGTLLECADTQANLHLSCEQCRNTSCPAEVLTAAALAVIEPLVNLEQRAFRQSLREFRGALQNAFEDELKQMLGSFSYLELASAGTGGAAVAQVLCETVEDELESRVKETGWDKAKRLTRRGTKATKAWLKTDEGKSVAGGAAVIATLLGFNFWG